MRGGSEKQSKATDSGCEFRSFHHAVGFHLLDAGYRYFAAWI
jgi:hypothetical protein